MTSTTNNPDFSTLLTSKDASALLKSLAELKMSEVNMLHSITYEYLTEKSKINIYLGHSNLVNIAPRYLPLTISDINNSNEKVATDSLITLFNILFAKQHVELVRGESEPEYFPAINGQLARIEFAHGFFASALHEISHWCIAGKDRRQLSDFGYWYTSDGRTATQQNAFERVEIKPQAIECLLTLACKRSFRISQDNLFADFDTDDSTFSEDVYQQVTYYLKAPRTLPRDAKTLLRALLII